MLQGHFIFMEKQELLINPMVASTNDLTGDTEQNTYRAVTVGPVTAEEIILMENLTS